MRRESIIKMDTFSSENCTGDDHNVSSLDENKADTFKNDNDDDDPSLDENEADTFKNDSDDDDPSLDENEIDTFENNHTYFFMLDDGTEGDHKMGKKMGRYYLTDKPRSIFVEELKTLTGCHSVTIMIEGGLDSLDVIARDLKEKRPVVIIHGSGRCATAIGNLLEITRDQTTIEYTKIFQ
jgi:hypothetical protein